MTSSYVTAEYNRNEMKFNSIIGIYIYIFYRKFQTMITLKIPIKFKFSFLNFFRNEPKKENFTKVKEKPLK